MKASRTRQNGQRTFGSGHLQLSRTAVKNKDPNYDYAFRKKDPISLDIAAQQGWTPVSGNSHKGEKWASPIAVHSVSKTAGKNEIHIEDTMLCKRPKTASNFYKQIEDHKYNSQIRLVNSAAERAMSPLREANDDRAAVKDDSTKFSQRVGPNDDSEVDIFS